ncbi:ABC transporter ATP-binding protein [Thermospira aquatica]|uniref:ATP-binding cassette domain-containing protein n=1 Tax=Thermospira aquatica TaxID=2828656 RepID=A0AAX3BDE7_9SPIR|nr:ATP-binding cassette domain-containing protein [Thermospira aquatica]URA10143.1 ATP-binding cassette domain-containing protein [Thermospira aquatica]
MQIRLINITKEYKVTEDKKLTSLKRVNLDINEGDYISLVGPSGSGKTTLLHTTLGLLRPSEGEVFWNKVSLSLATDTTVCALRRRFFGIVFQESQFIDDLSVGDNILLPLLINGISVRAKKEYFRTLCEKLKISHLLHLYPYQLSGGERKKASIARALIHSPEILVADEPTANLDEKSAQEIYHIFQNLNQLGLTILVATHDIRFREYCRESYSIQNGEITGFTHFR